MNQRASTNIRISMSISILKDANFQSFNYIDNIVIIGVIIAAFVGYSAYRQKNQGGGVTAGKKRA